MLLSIKPYIVSPSSATEVTKFLQIRKICNVKVETFFGAGQSSPPLHVSCLREGLDKDGLLSRGDGMWKPVPGGFSISTHALNDFAVINPEYKKTFPVEMKLLALEVFHDVTSHTQSSQCHDFTGLYLDREAYLATC